MMFIRSVFIVIILLSAMYCGALPTGSEDANTGDSGTTNSGGNSATANGLSFLLPFANGSQYELGQGFGGTFSHSETCDFHALDFIMDEGTDIHAVAPGRVVKTKQDSNSGGGTVAFADLANFVVVDHGEGYYASYYHLCQNCVDVSVGDVVTQGQVIGQSGNTGFSSEPHLHFSLRSWTTDCTATYGFVDVNETDGIPVEGNTYTSENDGSSSEDYTASVIPSDRFSVNGITPDGDFAWTMDASDTLTLTGTLDAGLTTAFLFIFDGNGNTLDIATAAADSNQQFTLSYQPDITAGSYYIALTGSDTNSGSSDFSVFFVIE